MRGLAILGFAILALATTTAEAQNYYQRQAGYARQQDEIQAKADASTKQALASINQSIAKSQAASDANLTQYIQQNGPRLQQRHVASGARRTMNFRQVANQEVLSHANWMWVPGRNGDWAGPARVRVDSLRVKCVSSGLALRRSPTRWPRR